MAEKKVIDKSFVVSRKRGNGTVRYEVWETDGCVTRYNLTYINHLIHAGDNGRVVGYDNKHGHHRHCFGVVELVQYRNFVDIERRFEQEWIRIMEEYHAQHTG